MSRQHVAICDHCGKRQELDPNKDISSLGWWEITVTQPNVGGPLRKWHFHQVECMKNFVQETFK